jgi:hypothetical protein
MLRDCNENASKMSKYLYKRKKECTYSVSNSISRISTFVVETFFLWLQQLEKANILFHVLRV